MMKTSVAAPACGGGLGALDPSLVTSSRKQRQGHRLRLAKTLGLLVLEPFGNECEGSHILFTMVMFDAIDSIVFDADEL